ncbi:MAG: hypothetical protein K2I75_03845 [Clostridiales bacterium]|nr:hypothetical protein [Clostridiales bacterium]
MKKRKLLLSTLAAAVFATSAGALVACGDGVDLPESGKQPTDTGKSYTVTFVPGVGAELTKIQGNTLTTNEEGKLEGTMPEAEKTDYTFLGWGLAAGQSAPTITTKNFNSHPFSEDTSVYAVFKAKDTPTPPGPPVVTTEEYDITFLQGEHGTLSGDTSVKTNKGIATFPSVIADDGWDFSYWVDGDGNTVTASTKFTKSTNVTAQYTEKETPPGPIVDPNALNIQVLAGGVSKVALDSYDAYLEDQTDGRLHDYGKAGIALNKDDVLTFTVGGTAIDFWPDGFSETIAGLVTYTAGQKNTSVTVKANGTYAIYLKEYDTGWVLDVQGTPDEPIPGPIETEDLNIQVLAGGVSKVTLDSYDAYLEEQTDGRLHDYGKAGIALSKDDVITFTVDGTAIDFWPDGFSETIAGLVTYTAGQKNTSVTVKANGTYAIYLKEYDTGWVLDVQGTPDEPIPGPIETEDLNIQVLAGGVSKVALDSYDAYLEEQTDGRLHDYGKADITLNKDDVITFTVDGTAIDFYLDGFNKTTILSLVTVADANAKNTSVTIKANGTYAIYLKEYSTGWVLNILGEVDEPNPGPQPTTEVAKVNDTTMTDNTANISHENEQGEPINETLTKEYMLQGVELAKDATVSFKVNDTVVEVWLEKKENVAISGANTRATSFTITADGEYDFYLQYYTDGGADGQGGWRVWVEGTTVTEPEPTPQPGESKFYVYGTVGGENKWSAEKGYEFQEIDPDANETLAKKYKVEVELAAGDEVKIFKTNDQDNEWNYNNVESGCLGENIDWNGSSNLEAAKAGTFTFYLKIGTDGGSSVWINFAASEQPPVVDPVTKADGIYIGENKVAALVVNTGNKDTGCTEYWFGGEAVQFTQGDKLTIYIGGKKLTNIYGLQGVTGDASNTSSPNTVLTITATGKYKVYLKLWKDSGNYTAEFAKDADVGDVSTLPSESCRVIITGTDNKTITLYLVDANGAPLNLSDYKMWAWGDAGNLLVPTGAQDDWNNRPTVAANMTAPRDLGTTINFKFTKGASESNNLTGIATGKIYVVTVGANMQLTIKEYTGA